MMIFDGTLDARFPFLFCRRAFAAASAAPDDGRGTLLAVALGRAHDLEAPLDEAFSERDDVGDEQPGGAVRPSFP